MFFKNTNYFNNKENGFKFPAWQDLFLSTTSTLDLGNSQSAVQCTGTLSPGRHWPGHVADSLCPSGAEIIEVISSPLIHLHCVFLLPSTPSWCSAMTQCQHSTAEACFQSQGNLCGNFVEIQALG